MKADETKINGWLKLSAVVVLVFLAIYLFADYIMPILGTVLSTVFPLILPFILALILAVLITPVINWVQRKTKMKRGATVGIVLVLVLVVCAGAMGVLFSQLVKEIYVLAADFADSSYGININSVVKYWEDFYSSSALSGLVDENVIKHSLENVGNSFSQWIVDALYKIGDVLRSAPSALFMLLVAGFATYYFCKDENMAVNFIAKITPKKIENAARDTYSGMVEAFLGYVRAQVILITVTAIISIIGFLILRTDYVLVMGFLVGFCDLLPILGPGTVFIPWSIYNFFIGDYFTGIGLLVVYGVAVCVRHVIQPKLIADGVGLHPLATIASLYFGLELCGVWGLIFGPIILVIVLGIVESINTARKKRKANLGSD